MYKIWSCWLKLLQKYFWGAKIKKLDRWLWSRPFQGWLAIGRLGLIVTNIHTKFEAYNIARYEARNGDAKCRKWDGFGVVMGHSRSLAMSPFDTAHMTFYSILIETMRLSRLWDTVSSLLKVADFSYPTCVWWPLWGWPHSNFKTLSAVRKQESMGYHVALL